MYQTNDKPNGIDRLKNAFNDNPLVVIGVMSGAVAAAAKLIDAVTKASNSRVWKKEVKRREELTKRSKIDYPKL
jgi:hypoxanthine-guanine phosphoribosyltransferase